jgi:tetratricopeptide (TPR) repeat protein
MGEDQTKSALQHMDKAYFLSNKDFGVGTMYVLALKINKQTTKAYDLAKQIADVHPEAPQAKMLLATCATTIQKYDEALSNVETLLKIAPPNLPPKDRSAMLLLQAICHMYKGDHAKAIALLEKSLVIAPNFAVNLTTLGEAYLKSGDVKNAKLNFEKALAINPKIPKALYVKGIIAEKEGNSELAKKSFEDAYAYGKPRARDNGEDYYLVYLACEKLGKTAEAQSFKSDAAQLNYTYDAPWTAQ